MSSITTNNTTTNNAAGMNNTSSSNWRNPTLAQQQKYGVRPLPDDFEPTLQEQNLLHMFAVVKGYEKERDRLKDATARAKLAKREADFQKLHNPKANKRRKRGAERDNETTVATQVDRFSDAPSSEDDDDDFDTIEDRREDKIEQLRQEVAMAKQTELERADSALRQEHLETREVSESLVLKRKQKDSTVTTSLIGNLTASMTPPHDFSAKLELEDRGTVLFPPTDSDQFKWTPPEGVFSPNDGALLMDLANFDVNKAQTGHGPNTLAVKFTAPADSKRFSINIAAPDHDDFHSVLFHFNPRQRERGGQLVVNAKRDGQWGQAVALPLSQVPLMFGQTACTLLVQITGEGFDIFVEDQHCARLEHRTELPSEQTNLVLQFPSTDDYGSPEDWTVYKVWWGNKPIMAQGDVSNVPGVNSYNSLHPRKLFVKGLSKIFSQHDVEVRKAELERAFHKYGGDHGVKVIAPTNSSYAFVEMDSERQCQLALEEMTDTYQLNQARRTRHEALQEERAAAAAKASGGPAAQTWD